LRSELEQWAASQSGELLFPNREGKMDKRSSDAMRTIYGDVRAASKIPDLTPRMCRTTFATLFQGDPRDVQDILGHSTVNLTMEVYRRPIMARQQVAVDELEGRLTGKVISLEKGRKSA
jgi:integrase